MMIFVIYSMEDVVVYVDEMIVMYKGMIQVFGSLYDLFLKGEEMVGWGLDFLEMIKF